VLLAPDFTALIQTQRRNHQVEKRMWRMTIVAAALAAALVPLPPDLVDRWYSAGFYAALQPAMTSLSNLVAFSLFDVLAAVVACVWFALAVRNLLGEDRGRGALRILVRTAVLAATLYLLFLLLWGFNYRRPRMRDTLPYNAAAVTAEAAAAAGRLAVDRLDALHDRAHAMGWPNEGEVDATLSRGFARALQEAGIQRAVVPARPKHTVLDRYFRSAGVDGMTDPFFLETLVARAILPVERAFVVAHEWSHLAGIADEGEANFTAWRACVYGSPGNAYSGWLFLYNELARAVPARDRAAMAAALGAGPRADVSAIRDRYLRDVNRQVSAAGWRVYDSYLKANRVEAGTASYDEVVRLVLGLRVNGRPVLDAP
jgi:hypothetical protein